MSTQETPAEKVIQKRKLHDAIEREVIARSICICVDGPWPPTMPGENLFEATRRLVRDIDNEAVTPYAVDRCLEAVVISGGFGSFYWDSSNKRHLRLNSPEWREKNRKKASPSRIEFNLGDQTGVYGADSR